MDVMSSFSWAMAGVPLPYRMYDVPSSSVKMDGSMAWPTVTPSMVRLTSGWSAALNGPAGLSATATPIADSPFVFFAQ